MIRVVLLLVTLTLEASVFIKNLKNSETKKLESLISGKSLTIIFQPNCSACKHQVQSLSCIKEDIKILLLGAFSNEKKLLKEYQKFKVNYPSFYASKDILKKLKITSSATPQIIYSIINELRNT